MQTDLKQLKCILVLLLFTEDASGWWTVTQDFISNNQVAVKTWALGILGVQLLAIAIASWLHSIYQAAYEAWMDVVEEREQRTRQQLGRAVAQNYAGEFCQKELGQLF